MGEFTAISYLTNPWFIALTILLRYMFLPVVCVLFTQAKTNYYKGLYLSVILMICVSLI